MIKSINSKSQINQDIILDENIFRRKTNGFFVEVGSLDGCGDSNTWFFEKERNWSGIVIEPNPDEFNKMIELELRNCHKENVAISDVEGEVNFLSIKGPCNVLSGIVEFYNPKHIERINKEFELYDKYEPGHQLYCEKKEIKVKSLRLETIFDKYDVKHIDFISIDVEGGEYQVLKSINFDKVNIDVIMIENNYGLEKETELLISKGYEITGNLQWDIVFTKKEFLLS